MQVVGTLRHKVLHHGGGGYNLASHMQVVGTLRHKVLHHGGGGITLPHIHSDARSCTIGVGVYLHVFMQRGITLQYVASLQ